MNISNIEIETMYKWIIKSMEFGVWYPVKSDKAYNVIIQLFEEGLINFCEFNSQETHIRKIDESSIKS